MTVPDYTTSDPQAVVVYDYIPEISGTKPEISVVVSTYNQPEWLEKVLWGYEVQSESCGRFEVVIADDGSDERTRQMLDRMIPHLTFPLRYVWQTDTGFRKCRIVNRGILATRSEYIVVTDGDCIAKSDFLATHLRLRRPGCFLSGGAVRLPMELSRLIGKDYLDAFVRIIKATGERDGFNTRPKASFERMLDALGEHVRMYMGFYQDQPICGAITTNYAGKACYVYGASDNVYRNVMPNYLMQWEMIRWAVETGCDVYDFQGISGDMENENGHMYGLYRFKRGFGGQVDELAGEFNYVYKPVVSRMVDLALWGNEKLRALRRRLRQ